MNYNMQNMFNYKKTNLPKSTYQFDVIISKDIIKNKYDQAFAELVENLEVKGFRKGKVPIDIAQKEIKKEKVYERLIQKILPELYEDIVKKESLRPITSPKIELKKAKEDQDWEIVLVTAEKPNVDLKNYQELIKTATADEKKKDIWTPGQPASPKEKTEQEKEEAKRKLLNKIFEALFKNIDVQIPDLLIETELNKKLTQLLDDVRKVGLTIDSYLASKNETIDSIKNAFKKEISEMYKLEFILEEIAEKQNITVEPKELEDIFLKIKDEKTREEAHKNSYFYASFLRRQKTLDYLLSL